MEKRAGVEGIRSARYGRRARQMVGSTHKHRNGCRPSPGAQSGRRSRRGSFSNQAWCRLTLCDSRLPINPNYRQRRLPMKSNRFAIALTLVNLAVLMFTLSRTSPATADAVAPVLRGRALEIVDDRGKVRASISVFPADPKVKMPDGSSGYPETVLLRLRDSKGRPNVKDASQRLGRRGWIWRRRRPDLCVIRRERCAYFVETEKQRRTRARNKAVGV